MSHLTMFMKPGLLSKPARSTPPIPAVWERETERWGPSTAAGKIKLFSWSLLVLLGWRSPSSPLRSSGWFCRCRCRGRAPEPSYSNRLLLCVCWGWPEPSWNTETNMSGLSSFYMKDFPSVSSDTDAENDWVSNFFLWQLLEDRRFTAASKFQVRRSVCKTVWLRKQQLLCSVVSHPILP